MKIINMNHAATSPTKPAEVKQAVISYLDENNHLNLNRGNAELESVEIALEARMTLGSFFEQINPSNIVFSSGATESLNMAINGFVTPGCHVISTSLEHNSVSRPLDLLEQKGLIETTYLPCNIDGTLDPNSIRKYIKSNTRLLVATHASNVLGTILPTSELFSIAKEYGIYTVLDSAQSVGHIEVKSDDNTDVIAFAGHKGLRGFPGIGGMVLSKLAAKDMQVWKAGGTGSHSQSLEMPSFLPDKFEPGTQNIIGMISLREAVKVVEKEGINNIREQEKALISHMIDGLSSLPVTIHGTKDKTKSVPVVSISIPEKDVGLIANTLLKDYGIYTRSGLHCSPLAHKTAGTFPEGTLRFSFSSDTKKEEIDTVISSLEQILC